MIGLSGGRRKGIGVKRVIRLEIVSPVDYGYNMRKKNTLNRRNPSYADLCVKINFTWGVKCN